MRNKCKTRTSKGETNVLTWLTVNQIKFVHQQIFNDCINPCTKACLIFDFFLPDHNIAIEFDGSQHYFYTPNFHNTKKDFLAQKARDRVKNRYCKSKKIRLIRISYKDNIYKTLSSSNILTISTTVNSTHEVTDYPFSESEIVF